MTARSDPGRWFVSGGRAVAVREPERAPEATLGWGSLWLARVARLRGARLKSWACVPHTPPVRLLVAWVSLLVACGGIRPPEGPKRETKLGVTISNFALVNGLRIVLVQDPRASEVQVTMRYQIGAVDDPIALAGVAHLVEHLMFQQVIDGKSVFARLEEITSYFDATTTFDATTYVERAAASRLGELLSIEAARLQLRCGSLSDSEFSREREVVVNELRQRSSASQVQDAIHAGLFPTGHPYRRSIGGSEGGVAAITQLQACSFADRHYGPTNAVLVVSGNLTRAQLQQALLGSLSAVSARTVAVPVQVARPGLTIERIETSAPIDSDLLLIAWPLPEDLRVRAKIRAMAPALAAVIDAQVKGRVLPLELGDVRAPVLALLVSPRGESVDDALRAAASAIAGLPEAIAVLNPQFSLGRIVFSSIKQSAIYEEYSKFEDGPGRDARLAEYVLAGSDPNAAIASTFQGLREITSDEASGIAGSQLGFERAKVVVLRARASAGPGHEVELTPAIHDLGQRRTPPDPAAASRPMSGTAVVGTPAGVRTRELSNGLKVVLLPLTSIPAVDMRLVFRAGTADEPPGARGAALVAANALEFDPHFVNDALLFAASGGSSVAAVGTDHTTFGARGVDMHLDYLLAGLRRWVREGRYSGRASSVLVAMRHEAKRAEDDGALTDRWRAAVFGPQHPYVRAGLVRHVSSSLSVDDAVKFRANYYTPDNATLVIAGRFDADLADQWVDFLFSDWSGHVAPRGAEAARPTPESIASDEATAQVNIRIAIPATSGDRAAQLVAAAVLGEIAGDVRHQLGASYGFAAQLSEERLASNYVVAGAVDAARASEAVALLDSRIHDLLTNGDRAAGAFVAARSRVLTHLTAVSRSAESLASWIEKDVAMVRPPFSDLRTSSLVRKLTLSQIAATLADLDLARAVVLMRGPKPEIDRAFAVLGRTPTYVERAHVATPDTVVAVTVGEDDDFAAVSEPAAPTTLQGLSSGYTLMLAVGRASGSLLGHDVSGFGAAVQAGYRVSENTSVGARVSFGSLYGTYETQFPPRQGLPVSVVPFGVLGFVQLTGLRRVWAAAMAGLILDVVKDGTKQSAWYPSLGVGLEGGIDLLKVQDHRFGVYGELQSVFVSDTPYSALTLGLAYRL